MRSAPRARSRRGRRDLIDSTIPARLDRLPWSRWHWRVLLALGVAWVLDGLEVTLVGSLGGILQRPETLGLSAGEVGASGSLYIGGAVLGCAFFRPPDGPARSQEALPRHPRGLYARNSGDGICTELRMVCRVPFWHGIRHRRGIRRDQFGDRRAHPRALARSRESFDQRQLLGRRCTGGGAEPGTARPAGVGSRARLARVLSAGRAICRRHRAGAPPRSGKPALATHPRARSRCRAHRRADRDADRIAARGLCRRRAE